MTSPSFSLRASLRGLEAASRAELVRLHLRTQVVRFVRLAVIAFTAQAATLGVHNWRWQAVASLLLGAGETAVRQLWPALPTAKLGALLRLGELLSTKRPSSAPAVPTLPSPGPAGSTTATPSLSSVPPASAPGSADMTGDTPNVPPPPPAAP